MYSCTCVILIRSSDRVSGFPVPEIKVNFRGNHLFIVHPGRNLLLYFSFHYVQFFSAVNASTVFQSYLYKRDNRFLYREYLFRKQEELSKFQPPKIFPKKKHTWGGADGEGICIQHVYICIPVQRIGLKILYVERVSILHYIFQTLTPVQQLR